VRYAHRNGVIVGTELLVRSLSFDTARHAFQRIPFNCGFICAQMPTQRRVPHVHELSWTHAFFPSPFPSSLSLSLSRARIRQGRSHGDDYRNATDIAARFDDRAAIQKRSLAIDDVFANAALPSIAHRRRVPPPFIRQRLPLPPPLLRVGCTFDQAASVKRASAILRSRYVCRCALQGIIAFFAYVKALGARLIVPLLSRAMILRSPLSSIAYPLY